MAKQKKNSALQPTQLGMDAAAIKQDIANQLTYTLGKDSETASGRDWYTALASSVRDRLMMRWHDTQRAYQEAEAKKVYYLSLEFMIGRSLTNAAINLDLLDETKQALNDIGHDLEELRDSEPDAGLGNGGLGRLAACFIDSMATLQLPGFGYGIRYDYGIFEQGLNEDGSQKEKPDYWLKFKNAWELKREDRKYRVQFGGRVHSHRDEKGQMRFDWVGTDDVIAAPFDTPIPGNKGGTVNHLRLWAGEAVNEFNFPAFNRGDYTESVRSKNFAENLSRVLYPDDTTEQGKELRLMQQFFFTSASLQDILADHLAQYNTLDNLAEKVAVQMNDTHPTIAVAELMRLLMDEHGLSWEDAWQTTTNTVNYTCHTLLPEALETWPVRFFEKLLPRHLEIIYTINHFFIDELVKRYPGDHKRIAEMSIIGEDGEKRVRMANLAIVGSYRVNGVAQLHSDLMKTLTFKKFHEFYPEKFTNVTNGVTPRRWLKECNPGLSKLITEEIGREWENDLSKISQLVGKADDAKFRKVFAAVKRQNKERLAQLIKERVDIDVNPDAMFDIQIKRIHEYKRQLLKVLHVVHHYAQIRKNPEADWVPRVVIIAGKAAPGYAVAKRIIKLINNISKVINNDPLVGDKLKLVYLPNYNVSMAQVLMPAADLSEQISTAGMEASGTGNMKMALNGALTIGTLDGANVEIAEEAGDENIFIFGMTADEVEKQRADGYHPSGLVANSADMREVLSMISNGFFSPEDPSEFLPLVELVTGYGEHFLVLADFQSYIETQAKVDELYRNQDEWMRKAVINSFTMGKFSSDRSIQDYADYIWNMKPVPVK